MDNLEDIENSSSNYDENCECSEDCTCGQDCKCNTEEKCNDECSCDESCNCDEEDKHCDCDEHHGEHCNCNKHNKHCDCDEHENDSDREDEDCEEDDEENLNDDNYEKEGNESDEYFKQLLTIQAEFDNYRKRTQSDISKAYQNGFNEAIAQFLPALDSFKMATDMITDKNTLEGIQFIEKGILTTLEKMGVTVIDTSGKFDPNLHQAIGVEEDEGFESGDIIKECFKGFKMGDKVIRYSQVIVRK